MAVPRLAVRAAVLAQAVSVDDRRTAGVAESLVPDYLAAVPIDPYSGRPLVYRRTGDGYLLYSVGLDGVDDGGQRVDRTAALREGTGDFFFDAPDRDVEPKPPAAQAGTAPVGTEAEVAEDATVEAAGDP